MFISPVLRIASEDGALLKRMSTSYVPASADWVVPTTDDIEDTLVAKAVDAFRQKNLGATQVDPFDNVMKRVTNRIRGEISKFQIISLTDNAIPPSILWVASALIVQGLAGRLPGVASLTDQQKDVIQNALDYLQRISTGDVVVEYPTDPMLNTIFQVATISTVVTGSERRATMCKLEGL